ncbi:hypothetical protein OO015_14045 [Thermomicrobium sp. 4228-Ro]|uniref:hypothetical protein n=1 Tax=Thermomicrobium sp. 4228-Ro TaxID=2993937 RepID=UPI002248B69E|nr:hypothetical protein [Thermomicrobium sp. 4228-Ro]MCX2728608.1 hypothetical protein [Thermomicrobium sp. 4228-Ro]
MQWILAYDGACGRCRAIAERVVALGGGRLAARSLREPEVAAWRERALGARAPWEPVLFAVAGDRLQAYTGRRLVLELVRLLGVRRGLALASELRELAPPAGAGPALTRRRVLGRLAGLGTALGLLASGKVAIEPQQAEAAPPPFRLNILTVERVASGQTIECFAHVPALVQWLESEHKWSPDAIVRFRSAVREKTFSGSILADTVRRIALVCLEGVATYAWLDSPAGVPVFAVEQGGTVRLLRPDELGLSLGPTADPVLQASANCCPDCRACLVANFLCAGLAFCCFTGNMICCSAAVGTCASAIIQCSRQLGCNCWPCIRPW